MNYMTAEVFLDTNVLVYAAVGTETPKLERALALIDSKALGTSAQVRQDLFVTVVKKSAVRPILSAAKGCTQKTSRMARSLAECG